MKKNLSKPSVQSARFSRFMRFMIHPIPERTWKYSDLSRTLKIRVAPKVLFYSPPAPERRVKDNPGNEIAFSNETFSGALSRYYLLKMHSDLTFE